MFLKSWNVFQEVDIGKKVSKSGAIHNSTRLKCLNKYFLFLILEIEKEVIGALKTAEMSVNMQAHLNINIIRQN